MLCVPGIESESVADKLRSDAFQRCYQECLVGRFGSWENKRAAIDRITEVLLGVEQ